jgi:hypothetical protein
MCQGWTYSMSVGFLFTHASRMQYLMAWWCCKSCQKGGTMFANAENWRLHGHGLIVCMEFYVLLCTAWIVA